jgi:hypothetical protein
VLRAIVKLFLVNPRLLVRATMDEEAYPSGPARVVNYLIVKLINHGYSQTG